MKPPVDLADTLKRRAAVRTDPRLVLANERAIFGTTDPVEISAQLDELLATRVESRRKNFTFYDTSVSIVVGAELMSGDQLAVKLHGRSREVVEATTRIQRALAASGYPAPAPIGDPIQWNDGVHVVVQAFLAAPRPTDAEVAAGVGPVDGFVELLERCAALDAQGLDRSPWRLSPDRLWPYVSLPGLAHDDVQGGGAWVEDWAGEVHSWATALSSEYVLGHADWNFMNVRLPHAVYDWDSLLLAPEAQLVGFAAWWARTPAAMRAFVLEYERRRRRAFSRLERRVIAGTVLWRGCCGARLEQALDLGDWGHHWRNWLMENRDDVLTALALD